MVSSSCRFIGCFSFRVADATGAWPSLLAGGACCAPSLLLLLGIPGLGAFVSLFAWMVPLALFLVLLAGVPAVDDVLRWLRRRLAS